MYGIQFVSIVGSLVLLVVILNLIRSDRLKIRYALLWICTSSAMFIFSIWRKLIDNIAGLMGIYYPPSILFLAAFLFLLIIVLHYSVVVSKLAVNERKLAQEIAVLTQKVKEMEKKGG